MTEYLTPEADFIPWSAAITGLAYLENMMKRSAGFGELRHYLLATLQPLYDRLGFQEVEGEKFLDEKLRIIMLEVRCGGARVGVTWPRVQVLCRLDHVECNEYSRYLVDQWMSLPNPDTESPIPVSIQGLDIILLDMILLNQYSLTPGTVLCSAVAQGNESVWDWLWQRYLNTHNANEKVVIMTSLTCSKEVWILAR